jgi:hypothetical protein
LSGLCLDINLILDYRGTHLKVCGTAQGRFVCDINFEGERLFRVVVTNDVGSHANVEGLTEVCIPRGLGKVYADPSITNVSSHK